jgi:NADH-quinone oxidoreductase subunit H
MTIMPALAAWAVVPFGPEAVLANVNAGLLLLMAITSIEVYGIIIAGWSSNSKYSFMGAMRASAQMISYEIPIGFVLVVVLMVSGSLNFSDIVAAQHRAAGASSMACLPVVERDAAAAAVRGLPDLRPGRVQPPPVRRGRRRVRNRGRPHGRILGHVVRDVHAGRIRQHDPDRRPWRRSCSSAAGTRRSPSWISAVRFGGFFWLFAKTFLIVSLFIWVRGTFPRYRYDQIMRLGWKIFIPVTLVWLVLVAGWMQTSWNIWK